MVGTYSRKSLGLGTLPNAKSGAVLQPLLKIGQLAKQTDLPVATLRQYENLGLFGPTQRGGSGYRYYSNETIGQIQFVKKAQALGFSIQEIRQLVAASGPNVKSIAYLRRLLDEKMEALERSAQQLTQLKVRLADYRDRQVTETSVEAYMLGLCELIESTELAPAN
jgi:DNA-binding transcriptional MerR regulator